MPGRHRKLSPLRIAARTGSLVAAAASTGLGVILAGGASQAATITPATPAAGGHPGSAWSHEAHLAHLAHLSRLAGYQRNGPARLTAAAAPGSTSSTGSTSGFQACVIARESGGDSQVMNASGHYGLYQFAYGTWVAYGGSPGAFGHASVAEQNQVFDNAIAAGGQSNWSPYDGC